MMNLSLRLVLALASVAFWSVPGTAATNQTLMLDGHVDNADGTPVTATTATVSIQVKSPSPSECILWSETQNVILANGDFTVEIGLAANRLAAAAGGAASDFAQVFINNPGLTIGSASCASGNSYTPTLTDDRVLSASVTPNGSTTITLGNLPLKSVPFAQQAAQIGGYGLMNLAKISGAGSSVSFTPVEFQSLKDLLGGDVFFDMKSRLVKNVATPVATTDAANKAYVDTAIAGVSGGGGGTVTSVGVSVPLSVTTPNTTPTISIAQATTTTDGFLSSTDWNTFNNKQAAGSYLGTTLAQNQVFIGNGSNVATAGYFGIGQMRNNIGSLQYPASCAASQTLTWSAVNDVLVCSNIGGLDASTIVTGTIGTSRLGSGTANSSSFLRGDGQWMVPSGADNLGNHTATQNLDLASFKLVGAGGSAGISIDATGKVGIGNGAPAALLDVVLPNGSSTALRLQAGGGQSPPIFDVRDGGGSSLSGIDAAGKFYSPNGSATSPAYNFFNSSLNTGMFSPAAANLGFSTGGIERIRVDASGNVGIGKLAPATKLHVGTSTDAVNEALVEAATTGRASLMVSSNSNITASLTANYSGSAWQGVPNGTTGIHTGNPSPFVFVTNTTEKMRIDTSGNIGIGTTSPGEKLDVNGSIRTSGDILVGNSAVGCSAPRTGAIRYNGGPQVLELCDGTSYKQIPAKNAMYIAGNTENSGLTLGNTYYGPLMGHVNLTLSSFTPGSTSNPVTRGGSLRRFFVKMSQTVDSNWTFTVMKNGGPTSITCIIGNTFDSCTDPTNAVSVLPGDDIGLKLQLGTGAGAAARISWALELESP